MTLIGSQGFKRYHNVITKVCKGRKKSGQVVMQVSRYIPTVHLLFLLGGFHLTGTLENRSSDFNVICAIVFVKVSIVMVKY